MTQLVGFGVLQMYVALPRSSVGFSVRDVHAVGRGVIVGRGVFHAVGFGVFVGRGVINLVGRGVLTFTGFGVLHIQ